MIGGPEAEALRLFIAHNQSYSDWSTLVVVFGLIGDVAVIFLYTKDRPLSEILLSAFCTTIIILGVYGEYHFGSKAAQGNAQLRMISDTKLADAEDRLGKAEGGLRIAIGEAGEANERAAKNEKEAARLRIENTRLLALIQPRSLSLEQRQDIGWTCPHF